MNFDDILKDAWRGESRHAASVDLSRRVRRQRRRHRLLRALEVALTLMAVLVFGHALASGRIGPPHWLLLPFYLVFLPVAWAFILRTPRRFGGDVAENVQSYAKLRIAQLRTGLRDLWLARVTAWSLLAYAIAANVGVWTLGDADWRAAGLTLLGFSLAWIIGMSWFGRWRRRALLREYRSMKSLTGA
ncbi:hypothetical protein [Pseudoxanthomonas suwonensis]|uniref:Transmembrane protein n=1 Tax=Pseudoxanthomonas suwonensis TaxID=314722 RepID=A0A0E3Z0I5_9GAMM|nr:hypothetical protein [Pseudoxanthomonas suwonensis]AKC86582.1 hypothetical protein WQ53_07180 [Pseudoxanthomonas suwonensis]